MSESFRTSVIVPSYGRPAALERCLASLAEQTVAPDEVIVVWQADDTETRETAARVRGTAAVDVRVVHSDRGIVPAENAGLRAVHGDVVFLIDDDAVAPPNWIQQHLSNYRDDSVGACGGPVRNHHADGTPFATRTVEPVGRLTWYGRTLGNHYDHPAEWSTRAPREVDHLMGPNMSFRRSAFDEFESGLRPYWQMFELDACLQVRRAGFRIVFDFTVAVDHHPSKTAFAGGRDGDLATKVYHAAYNHAFVLSKHAVSPISSLAYMLLIGSVATPGVLASFVSITRYGRPLREVRVLLSTIGARLKGWRDGARKRVR